MAAVSKTKERVLAVTRPGIKTDEVIGFYKTWAKEYDQDHVGGGANYTGPRKVAEAVAAALGERRDTRVLDVAAGTGFLGVELSKLGFTNVDALDASQEMLDVAKTKNVYKNFLKEFLGPDRLNIDDDTYDVVTGSGLFSNGHVKSDCLDELIRVVKPGGLVCLALREILLRTSEDCKALEPRMAALQSEGRWEQIRRDVFPGYVIGFDGVVFLFKVM
ncbi:methyltransferase-like protein 27 [Branchiostoma lanceolatum]|uniref:methyltransferase-like protein 27 n=1 Tax=Branchiostoma lanceolatum TaxID=7740 RepID=UPI00345438E9